MDAQAHLMSLGWAGPGHALDSRPHQQQYVQKGHRGLAYDPARDPLKVGNTGNGLVKPLSISRRKDKLGIGKKSHEPAKGTEWWLKGFESALGNIGKTDSERSTATNSSDGIPVMGIRSKHNGLYGFFVKGQMMEGTISKEVIQNLQSLQKVKKRKSEVMAEVNTHTSDGETSTKRARTNGFNGIGVSPVRRKPETASDFVSVGAFIQERDSKEKRRSKKQGISEKDQFAQVGQFFTETEKAEKRRKTKAKGEDHLVLDSHSPDTGTGQTSDNDDSATAETAAATSTDRNKDTETKEERRERRRKRKEQKEKEKLKHQEKHVSLAAALARHANGFVSDSEVDIEAEKQARRAERRRRKAEKEARRGVKS